MKKTFLSVVCSVSVLTCITFNQATAFAATGTHTDSKQDLQIISKVSHDTGSGYIDSYFVDENGDITTPDTSSDEPVMKKFATSAEIPSSYSLIEQNLTTPIKSQGVTGACWSFAAVKSAESNYIKKGYGTIDSTDFSENHLCWFTFHPNTISTSKIYNDGYYINEFSNDTVYSCGGNALMAVAKLATWAGFDIEQHAPFAAETVSEERQMSSSMESVADNLLSNSYAHLQNADCYDNATLTEIKQAILNHGALDIAMYYDNAFFDTTHGKAFYNSKYSGVTAKNMANHCVTIVGWDDSYPRSNFKYKPASDGAWLIANSYGSEYNDNGYFWLSYYEPSINEIYSFDVEKPDNYSHNYQYDGAGWNDAPYYYSSDISGANVFTAGKSRNQSLKAVGLYTITDSQAYTISVYRFLSGSSPSTGTLVSECTTSGTARYSGYHTITLKKPCSISAGEKFAVAVRYAYNSSTGNPAYLPCEGGEGSLGLSSGISYSASSKTGQSFIYLNGKWTDTKSISRYDLNNVCIKAFTTNTSVPVTAKSGKNTDITLGKGETYKLSSGNSYINNEPFVATVSSSGKITAKNSGKTIIGISKNGSSNYTSTVTVNVKKAPSKIILSPSGKKTLKKGKSFVIKTSFPSGSASNKVTFTSSNKKIATVSQKGKVTAKKAGKTTISAKTYNKKTAKITVTVTK